MDIVNNLNYIQNEILETAKKVQRDPNSIQLLAVSKKKTAQDIRTLFQARQKAFGENYVQEALAKIHELQDLPIEWHFIGRIQSNKTHDIATHFSWAHAVDRDIIAKRLNEHRPAHLPPLQVCIQINFADEFQKGGIAPIETLQLATTIMKLPRLKLRGLMVLPPEGEKAAKENFKQLAALKNALEKQGIPMDTLSMGMTHDFKIAIAEGATIVRIGSAIFGSRD